LLSRSCGRTSILFFTADVIRTARLKFFCVHQPANIPRCKNIKRLEQAYSLKEELDPAWAVRAIEFAWHWDRTVLVLEDPGGVPLDQLIGQPLDLAFSLRIAISLLSAGRYLPGATHARERASPRVHQSGPTPQTSPYRRRTLVNARGTGVDLGEAPTLS
jgi:hypothetical protein